MTWGAEGRPTSAEPHPLAAHWLPSLAASILDQVLSSGTNFGLALFVARWTNVVEYGAFAVAFSVHLFVAHAYNELVPEPMTVLASSDYAHCWRSYLRALIKAHALVAALFATALASAGGVAWFGGRNRLGLALLSCAGAQTFTLGYWLLRRIAYLRADAWGAARASALYALCAAGGVVLLGPGGMSAPSAYLVLAGSALAAALSLYARHRPRLPDAGVRDLTAREVLRRHLQFARWTLPASLAHALGVHSLPSVLAASAGLPAAAILRAAQNLTTPIFQVQSALGLLMLPRLAARHARAHALTQSVVRFALLLLALSAGYCVFVLSFGAQLLALAYGRTVYAGNAWLLDLLLPAVLLSAGSGAFSAGLRAQRAVRAVFWSKAAAGVAACVLGPPLVLAYGLAGVGWALLCTAAAETLSAAVFFFRIRSRMHGEAT
jgi:O-antigen/teichoic acid export membrane protein